MLLYRYFSSHAYETLKEAKLKTSRITAFNDPFEFLFVTKGKISAEMARDYVQSRLSNPECLQLAAQQIPGLLASKHPQKLLAKHVPGIVANMVKESEKIIQMPLNLREQMADKSIRVISFSDATINQLDEILLWSHYARMHEGTRIGFTFPDGIRYPFKISKVIYQDKRFTIDFALSGLGINIGQALVESAKVKSSAWRYEKEHRLLTHPELCEQRKMPDSKTECFIGFKREWVTSIDFGVRCPLTEIKRIVDLIKSDYSNNVSCRKGVFHKSEYALEYEPIGS